MTSSSCWGRGIRPSWWGICIGRRATKWPSWMPTIWGQVKILAASPGVERELVEQALGKNPAGNAAEQTPLVLIRKMTPD
jgi:hypothetical protein